MSMTEGAGKIILGTASRLRTNRSASPNLIVASSIRLLRRRYTSRPFISPGYARHCVLFKPESLLWLFSRQLNVSPGPFGLAPSALSGPRWARPWLRGWKFLHR
jgi:hypothetical protein